MGTMSFVDFSSELGFLLGNRNNTDATNPVRLSRWINQAYTYMCHPSVHHFREMQAIDTITLVTGTNVYDIGAITSGVTTVAIRWISYVEDSTGTDATVARQRLKPRGIRWMEQRAMPSGRPVFYAPDGTNVHLYAVPSSVENGNVLRVGLYREPATISADTATVVNSYFDRPLVKFAQAFAEADLGDRALALVTLKEASGLLNNASAENEMEAEDSGFQVEVLLQPVMGV